jgi:hypothetical protein
MKGKRKPEEKSYVPSETLERYLNDRVTLNRKIQKFKLAGEKISEDLDREDRNVRRRKVDVLDNHIFPSMANIVIFFEYLAKYPELSKLFEDDVKELFGYIKDPYDTTKETEWDYSQRTDIFKRLIESILTWDKKNDLHNFRIYLINTLEEIIYENIITLIRLDKPLAQLEKAVIHPDFMRIYSYTRIFAYQYLHSEEAEKDRDALPSRTMTF